MASTKTDSAANRWAMVTGASSGIGRAAALALAADGWNVGVHYRRSLRGAQAVAEEIAALGRSALFFKADLSSPGAAKKLVPDVWRQTGGVAAWVHVAGADLLTGNQANLPFERKLELATKVDLWGTMLVCRAAGEKMRSAGGAIVTVGWDQAATGMEGDSGELFAAIKGGVMAFSRSLAKSLAPQVRVNCVAPGWIKTAWGEHASAAWQERAQREALLKRWGQPQEVADAIAFLVSDRARFVTGQTLYVNGGAVVS